MTEIVLIVASVFIVSIVSFASVFFLGLKDAFLKKILMFLVSFSAGALFGDAFIHLLPEAVEVNGFTPEISLTILSGIVLFFAMEKLIKWHHHHTIDHQHEIKTFGYMNLFGDGLHNFIDGTLIAGSYLVDTSLGVATTIAVILHEIPQEIGDFGVLLQSGFTKKKALFFNFLSAITAFLGVIAAVYLSTIIHDFEVLLIAFTAGGFIYIAGSDLIPELHNETKILSSLAQVISFIAGIVMMFALIFLE